MSRDIDFSALQDNFGQATEVPKLIGELGSKEGADNVKKLRKRLILDVDDIWISPAGEAAIPLFIDWLGKAEGAPAVRAKVATLLADLVCGGDHLHSPEDHAMSAGSRSYSAPSQRSPSNLRRSSSV